jgi:hypothetical protein
MIVFCMKLASEIYIYMHLQFSIILLLHLRTSQHVINMMYCCLRLLHCISSRAQNTSEALCRAKEKKKARV